MIIKHGKYFANILTFSSSSIKSLSWIDWSSTSDCLLLDFYAPTSICCYGTMQQVYVHRGSDSMRSPCFHFYVLITKQYFLLIFFSCFRATEDGGWTETTSWACACIMHTKIRAMGMVIQLKCSWSLTVTSHWTPTRILVKCETTILWYIILSNKYVITFFKI
jgi:hypothetical protein